MSWKLPRYVEGFKKIARYLVTVGIINVKLYWCFQISCEFLIKDIRVTEYLYERRKE